MKTYTDAQRRAIESKSENICLVAGPGSGKTATVVERIKQLILSGVPSSSIVAITFTNAGANELQKQIIGNVKHGPDTVTTEFIKLGFCGTLHGFALRMLKRYGATIGYGERIALIDEEASTALIEQKAKSLGCKTKIDKLLEVKRAGRPDTKRTSLDWIVIAGYYDEMREGGLVDFDLLLTEFARLIQTTDGMSGRFRYLFVDEVQDSASIDWEIYKSLPIQNKFFVGDPDQAIYGFRGGNVASMLGFSVGANVEVIRLEENFRSHSEICDAANKLIEHNAGRIRKATIGVKGPGGHVIPLPSFLNEGAEIADIVTRVLYDCMPWLKYAPEEWKAKAESERPMTEIAILARTNDQVHAFHEALKASGVPVTEEPKSTLPADWSYARSLIELFAQPTNDVVAFFALIEYIKTKGGASDVVARAEARMTRLEAAKQGKSIYSFFAPFAVAPSLQSLATLGVSAESRYKIADIVNDEQELSFVELALAMQRPEPEPVKSTGVTVTTFHGAKGREFDVVFLVGCEDEYFPGLRKDDGADAIEEARRLFFVGVTRARKALYLSGCRQRKMSWGAIVQRTPSRFLKEML